MYKFYFCFLIFLKSCGVFIRRKIKEDALFHILQNYMVVVRKFFENYDN